MANLLPFTQITKNDVVLVGGKGASLGEMTQAGIPVPPGFVITTDCYRQFSGKEISQEVKEEILKAFDTLGAERVAVRSSAVAEDSSSASWAGQLESYLNVSRENLIENVIECWKSIKSQGALLYAGEQNVGEEKLLVAVVIQKMVESEVSGVMFTVNPVNRERNELMIESIFGLGELIVQGMVTPDNFIVDKESLEVKNKNVSEKSTMYVFKDGQNQELPVPSEKAGTQSLPDEKITELAEIGIKIEEHYGVPQDIEWGLEDDILYILQSRPITTL